MLTRDCSHCLVKNNRGCSFSLFNYDSYVSFRASGVIWGIRVDCRAGVFARLDALPCSLPCGTDNLDYENHLYVNCPGVGQVARGLPTRGAATRWSWGASDCHYCVISRRNPGILVETHSGLPREPVGRPTGTHGLP